MSKAYLKMVWLDVFIGSLKGLYSSVKGPPMACGQVFGEQV